MPTTGTTVVVNGVVESMVPTPRAATAVIIVDGVVAAVGDDASVLDIAPARAEVLDARGGTICPGFVDAHTHWSLIAGSLSTSVDVRSPKVGRLADILDEGRRAAESAPPGNWLVLQGSSFQDQRLEDGRFPLRDDLDQISRVHPVVYKSSMHNTVVNSAALELLGIDRTTPDPPGARIVRDATGRATGPLLDMLSMLPIRPATSEQLRAGLSRVVDEHLAPHGVTCIHEITDSLETLRLQREVLTEGAPLRMVAFPWVPTAARLADVADPELRARFNLPGRLVVGGIKLFADGGTSSKTAAFYDGYEDDPGYAGSMVYSEQELTALIAEAEGAGLQVLVHACGDRAQDVVLSAYEKASTSKRARRMRHRIEHMGNVGWSPERAGRCRSAGVLPVPNLGFVATYGSFWPRALGIRAEGCVPFRSMLLDGFPVPGTSDMSGADLEPLNPLHNILAAIRRRTITDEVVGPDEAIDLITGLTVYTRHGAEASGSDLGVGVLAPGRRGDVVILSHDVREVGDEELEAVRVQHTLFDGSVVYSAA